MIKKFFIFIPLLFGLFFLSCATNNNSVTDTPEKRLFWMWSVYNSQYADYMMTTGYEFNQEKQDWIKTSNPVLSEERKEVLRFKKEKLTEVYPLIKTYDFIVTSTVIDGLEPSENGEIDQNLEQRIYSLLNELLGY